MECKLIFFTNFYICFSGEIASRKEILQASYRAK